MSDAIPAYDVEAVRRDTGCRAKRFDARTHHIGNRIGMKRHTTDLGQFRARLKLQPPIGGITLRIGKERQATHIRSARRRVNIIIEAVPVTGQPHLIGRMVGPYKGFNANRPFGAEVGIAQFIGLCRSMRPIRIQLFCRRCPDGARHVDTRAPVFRQWNAATQSG